jgi:prepilin-type N-terminal cleavage/methylation domain-containing protein
MSPTRNYNRALALGSQGFTLVELLVATSIATVLIGGMLSSYLFLGRNLIRDSNRQELEAQSRNMLQTFARDVGVADRIAGAYNSAGDITSDSSWQTMPTSGQAAFRMSVRNDSGGTYYYAVTYAYNANADTVTRTVSSGLNSGTPPSTFNANFLTLLRHASDFRFNYLDRASNTTGNQLGVKQIEVASFTLTNGIAAAGTQSIFTGASARLVLRNRHLVN